MSNKKDFNSQFATLKLREEIEESPENISEEKTIFSIDDQEIDDLFLNKFPGTVDYLHDGPDVYYATDQNDLQKFVDYIESLGLDSKHIKLRTNFQEDGGASPAGTFGNTTSNAGAYNASLNAPSKKQNPFKEDVLSGYKELKGFRPGHTPDKGGFQYKDLWDLNENYSKFKNETKTRSKSEQFHQAVKSVKKKIEEINKLYEYMERLKTELSEGSDGLKYKKYTENAIFKIKEAVKALHFKTKKLK